MPSGKVKLKKRLEDKMRSVLKDAVILLLSFSFLTFLYGSDSTSTNQVNDYETIEKNLLVRINSDN